MTTVQDRADNFRTESEREGLVGTPLTQDVRESFHHCSCDDFGGLYLRDLCKFGKLCQLHNRSNRMQPEPKQPKDRRVTIMMSEGELEAVDDWRFANRVATRAEAIRRLCQIALYGDDQK